MGMLSSSALRGQPSRQFFSWNIQHLLKPKVSNEISSQLNSIQLNVFLEQRLAKHSAASKYSRGKDGGIKEEENDDEELSTNNLGLDPSILADVDGKDVKIIKSKLNSMRLDSLLKAGLGTAKHKVEEAFYDSRIRVNGEKILKKSKRMEIGDEIDLIKGQNVINPDFLDISRVTVIAAEYQADLERVIAIIKRYKSLTIENYQHAPYRGGN